MSTLRRLRLSVAFAMMMDNLEGGASDSPEGPGARWRSRGTLRESRRRLKESTNLTQGGVVYYFSCLQGPNPTPVWELNDEWLTPSAGGAPARVVYYFSCLQGPNPTPVWELNG